MTDRVNALLVVLDKDMRVDDAGPLISAIKILKGVKDVGVNVADPSDYIAYVRAKTELENKLWELLNKRERGE